MTGARDTKPGIAFGDGAGARDTELFRDSANNWTTPPLGGFVDAEIIKAKLDEIFESATRIEGRLEAIQASLDSLKEDLT